MKSLPILEVGGILVRDPQGRPRCVIGFNDEAGIELTMYDEAGGKRVMMLAEAKKSSLLLAGPTETDYEIFLSASVAEAVATFGINPGFAGDNIWIHCSNYFTPQVELTRDTGRDEDDDAPRTVVTFGSDGVEVQRFVSEQIEEDLWQVRVAESCSREWFAMVGGAA